MQSKFSTLDLCYCALFAVLMAVGAWIHIPGPVPFTLQTFSVFAALLMLGGRRGTVAILVYLLLGAVGLPVFAGFQGGLGALLGPTGGYILGFLALGLLYTLVTAKLGNTLWPSLLGSMVGMAACYAFGTAWFVLLYSAQTGPMTFSAALGICVLPFLPLDVLKLALAVILSSRVRPHLK